MIFRRISEGIRQQDWFVVGVEILIVVLGVYIGIYAGEITEDRAFQTSIHQSLGALEAEMRSDMVRLSEVLAVQDAKAKDRQRLFELLSAEDPEREAISELIVTSLSGNSTYFPSRGSYETMLSSGYLAALPDPELRQQITLLFEREFKRQDFVALLYDNLNDGFKLNIRDHHWDRVNHRALQQVPDSRAVLRNGVLAIMDRGTFYRKFLAEQIRPEIVRTLEMIDAFQAANP